MAKRFLKPTIDWVKLDKLVPVEDKPKYLVFKAKSDEFLRRVQVNPPEPPPIDWESYRKAVPAKGLVDTFKQKYEAFKVPYPIDNMTVKVDEQWKSLEPEIKKFCDDLQKDIDAASKEIARLKDLLPFEEMTMEDVVTMYPENALDPIRRPTFWPHDPDDQYVPPKPKPKPSPKAAKSRAPSSPKAAFKKPASNKSIPKKK